MKKLGESMNISREEKNQNRSFVFKVPGAGNRSKEDIKNYLKNTYLFVIGYEF